jgi:fimbrial protein
MKRTILALLGSALLFSGAQGAEETHARGEVSGEYGNVHFHGRVYTSPCVLDMASREQTIDLGDISARRFHQAGDRSQPVSITLRLNDCLKGAARIISDTPALGGGGVTVMHSTAETGIGLTFMAEAAPGNSDLVRIHGDVQGAGLRLLSARAWPLSLNQPQQLYVLKPGDNVITLMAALESTESSVTAGEFYGLVRLKLEYL